MGIYPDANQVRVWMYDDMYIQCAFNSFHFAFKHDGCVLFIGYNAHQAHKFLVMEFQSTNGPITFIRDISGNIPMSNTMPREFLDTPQEVARAVRNWHIKYASLAKVGKRRHHEDEEDSSTSSNFKRMHKDHSAS